jgi:hypothetical protein
MEPSSITTTPRAIDIHARTNDGLLKVRSIRRGRLALRGGDFILNQNNKAMTVSFCFGTVRYDTP